MNTEHISFELLSRYLDGDFIPVSEKSRIEEHLKTCARCRAEYEKIKKMVSMLGALSLYGLAAPSHFCERAIAHIVVSTDKKYTKNRIISRKHYVPASAVAAIVMAVIGFSIFTTETLHNVSPQMTAHRAAHKNESEAGAVIDAMNAVRNAGGTVVEVSDTYLMVEAPAERVGRIRRTLPGCPVEVLGYVADRNALAVSSAGARTASGSPIVKMKITVK